MVALAVGASLALDTGASAQAGAHSPPWVARCGFARSPYGRLGVYIERGQVSCGKGRRLIQRAFHGPGESVGTGSVRDPDGWVCGGQMGSYFCAKPLWHPGRHPDQYVAALACHMGSGPLRVRCPRRIERNIP
jgi:hypothetical protein